MTNSLTMVSLMLTLASLIGTFFYVQLSAWARDVLAVKQKAELNKQQGTPDRIKAIIECRIEHAKLFNLPTYLVNFFVIAFVVYVLVNALLLVGRAPAGDAELVPYVATPLWVFLGLFIVLSSILLGLGTKAALDARALFTYTPPASSGAS